MVVLIIIRVPVVVLKANRVVVVVLTAIRVAVLLPTTIKVAVVVLTAISVAVIVLTAIRVTVVVLTVIMLFPFYIKERACVLQSCHEIRTMSDPFVPDLELKLKVVKKICRYRLKENPYILSYLEPKGVYN